MATEYENQRTLQIARRSPRASRGVSAIQALADRIELEKLLEQNGAVFNGTTDDGPAMQTAFNKFTANSRGPTKLPAGITAKSNMGLSLISGAIALDMNGAIIDFSGMTSGYALSVVNNTLAPFSRYSRVMPIRNGVLIGPANPSTTVDGLFVGRPSGVTGTVTGQSFKDMMIYGFRDGLYIGDQAYIDSLYELNIESCYRYGVNYQAATNAGENIRWFGGRISDCLNGGNAVGIYMANTDSGSNALELHSVSLDYNDKHFSNNCGVLELFGCHMEDTYTGIMGELIWNSGDEPAIFRMVGGRIVPVEASPGRARLFEVTGDRAVFDVNAHWQMYDKTTECVAVLSGNPSINVTGAGMVYGGTLPATRPNFSSYTNVLYNGDFELNAYTGWINTTGASGYTFTIAAAGQDSGTYCASMVSASAGNGQMRQSFVCRPGQHVFGTVRLNVSALSAGNVFVTSRFVNDNPESTTINTFSATNHWTYNATTGGYVSAPFSVRAPAGCSHGQLVIAGVSHTGTTLVDNARVWVH